MWTGAVVLGVHAPHSGRKKSQYYWKSEIMMMNYIVFGTVPNNSFVQLSNNLFILRSICYKM